MVPEWHKEVDIYASTIALQMILMIGKHDIQI